MTKKTPFFDRDLSWLSFNYRILMEAADETVPLLERLRFLAIYSSNLDEFFRVRVAYHRELNKVDSKKVKKKIGGSSKKLLKTILQTTHLQLAEYGKVLNALLEQLADKGVVICTDQPCIPAGAVSEVSHYFRTTVQAYLRPQVIEDEKSEYFLNNGELYFGLRLQRNDKQYLAFVNVPSNKLPRFYCYREGKVTYDIFLDNIVADHLAYIFQGYEVLEHKSIKLNKDADLYIDDEFSGDLVKKIEKHISLRNLGDSTRFLYDRTISHELLNKLKDFFDLQEEDLAPGGSYHNLHDFFEIKPARPELEYPDHPPIKHPLFSQRPNILREMEKRDHILHFPYESFEYVLQFFNEAVTDPQVTGINATFYRMARDSQIGEALISAARNGKQVNVFMEVKARFDEENNLQWARRMKEAGVKIIYSMPGLKVHAKVAQIRKKVDGKTRYYGFFGTGNLNEETAKVYCDHGLLSCHQAMNEELNSVFRFLLNKKEPPPFKELLVSQFGAPERFQEMVEREIEAARAGRKAKMIIKINNLEDKGMIEKLYEAAAAGVQIDLLVRSICCLVPGTEGLRVKRVVGRYLEHARLYYFYNGGEEELYLGSSDWMKRNLYNRVEVSFPVYDPAVRDQLMMMLEFQLNDTSQAVHLGPNLENLRYATPQNSHSCQDDFYHYLKEYSQQALLAASNA